jgi:hypothetical protein
VAKVAILMINILLTIYLNTDRNVKYYFLIMVSLAWVERDRTAGGDGEGSGVWSQVGFPRTTWPSDPHAGGEQSGGSYGNDRRVDPDRLDGFAVDGVRMSVWMPFS